MDESIARCMDGHGNGSVVIDQFFMGFSEKMGKCFKAIVSKYTADTQIKPYHIPFIAYIGHNDGSSQKDMCSCLPFDKSRVSTVVHELMDLGLVVNNSDGKVTSIHLTESGKNIFAMCQMLKELMHTLILQDFTEEELECLAHLISKMDRRMDCLLDSLKANR